MDHIHMHPLFSFELLKMLPSIFFFIFSCNFNVTLMLMLLYLCSYLYSNLPLFLSLKLFSLPFLISLLNL
ncbi:hypothetical protein VNO78_07619 [Psophocarpus tetragonolobus]|uniref:Uncharacterized protein n=1 Tax=Psophocarpus tetragonolobus TaxID=3891 RepID=A0AAN9SVM7_PSOTE